MGVMLRPMSMGVPQKLAALAVVLTLSACGSAGPTRPTQKPYGTTAIWESDPANPPTMDGRSFTALVRRLACSDGKTAPVRDPRVVEAADKVVVTFTLDALPSGFHNCVGGPPVAHQVTLTAPLGHRRLFDGACSSKAVDAPKRCDAEGQRWPRPG